MVEKYYITLNIVILDSYRALLRFWESGNFFKSGAFLNLHSHPWVRWVGIPLL